MKRNKLVFNAPVAQLDRALVSGTNGPHGSLGDPIFPPGGVSRSRGAQGGGVETGGVIINPVNANRVMRTYLSDGGVGTREFTYAGVILFKAPTMRNSLLEFWFK